MNSLEKMLIEHASKLTHAADGDWNYWVHSTDYVQWKRLFFCGHTCLKELAGRQLLVDDTSPLFFKNQFVVHDQHNIELDARAMVLHGLHRSLLERVKEKPKLLFDKLALAFAGKQKNHLIDSCFHWYLHPETLNSCFPHYLHWDPDAEDKHPHPDNTTAFLLGRRVRTDKDAPKGDEDAILEHSIKTTVVDNNWYDMWARRWKVDRKTAKYALCLYVYGPQQAGEKEVIKRHYDKMAADSMSYMQYTGKAKDVLKEKGVDLSSHRWRQSYDGHWQAMCTAHSAHKIVNTHLQRVTEAIQAGHRQTAIRRISMLLASVVQNMVEP